MTAITYFKNKKETRRAYAYSVPCIAEKLLILASSLINVAFAGHLGSAEIFAAVSVSTTILLVTQNALNGYSLGIMVVSSQLCGHGDKNKVAKNMFNSLFAEVTAGLVFMLALLFFRESIAGLLFKDLGAGTLKYLSVYLGIVAVTIPMNAFDITVSYAMRGCGQMKLPMVLTIIANLLGIVFGYIFMFVLKWGIAGAGWAYFINRAFGCFSRLIVTLVTKKPYMLKPCKISANIIKRISSIGLPSGIEQMMLSVGFLATQSITSVLGAAAISGFSAADNLVNISYCFNLGFEAATITQIGEKIGAGERKAAKQIANGNLLLFIPISLIVIVLIFVFTPSLIRLLASSPAVIASGIVTTRLECISAVAVAFMHYMQGVLTSYEKVRCILLGSIMGVWAIRVPIAYLLVNICGLGMFGYVAALTIDMISRCVIYFINIKKIKW